MFTVFKPKPTKLFLVLLGMKYKLSVANGSTCSVLAEGELRAVLNRAKKG